MCITRRGASPGEIDPGHCSCESCPPHAVNDVASSSQTLRQRHLVAQGQLARSCKHSRSLSPLQRIFPILFLHIWEAQCKMRPQQGIRSTSCLDLMHRNGNGLEQDSGLTCWHYFLSTVAKPQEFLTSPLPTAVCTASSTLGSLHW